MFLPLNSSNVSEMKLKSNYEGRYRIKRAPVHPQQQTAVSWAEIERVVSAARGVAEFDELSIAVKNHKSGTKTAPHPYQFITYYIRSGWLVRVD